MPSRAESMDSNLHHKLANFVLDLQEDVRLEDLLDNNENERGKQLARHNMPEERKQVHIKHLTHLYNEIKNQQSSVMNMHGHSRKRAQSDNNNTSRNKTIRPSECCLLHDTDSLDETWLLNFASQLGLDKKRDLPELNCEFMQGLL